MGKNKFSLYEDHEYFEDCEIALDALLEEIRAAAEVQDTNEILDLAKAYVDIQDQHWGCGVGDTMAREIFCDWLEQEIKPYYSKDSISVISDYFFWEI